MATKLKFGNKTIHEPGAYSRIISGAKNQPLNLSYGNILLIDTGSGAGWGCGSGINGALKSGLESLQVFSEVKEFQNAVKGGEHWLWGKFLFKPDGFDSTGISKLNFVRACTTVCSELTFAPTGGGAAGGTIVLKTRDEGIVGNGDGRDDEEILAIGTLLVTGIGTTGDIITIESDEGGVSPVLLCAYTQVAGDTTPAILAGHIEDAITALSGTHKYTATVDSATVSITAKPGSGGFANNYILQATYQDVGGAPNPTITITNFTGGRHGTLIKGYGMKMFESNITTGKFYIKYYVGSFKGYDTDLEPYDFVEEGKAVPIVVATSDDFSNIEELHNWMLNSTNFAEYFEIKTYVKTGTGVITSADHTKYQYWTFSKGGTETYSADDLDDVLAAVKETDYTFALLDDWGTDALSSNNETILAHLVDDSKYGEFAVIGGGIDSTKFTDSGGSVPIAEHYDSENVIVVHSGFKKVKPTGGTYKKYDSIVKACAVLGRICGLPPQVPATFKSIDMDADNHEMTENQRILALQKGVLHTRWDNELGKYVINQAINSRQDNDYLTNPDGTSYEVSVMRIAAQLNKEIVYNAKRLLLAQPYGVNRNTLSKGDIKNFVEGYLTGRTATDVTDNLIISFRNVTVTTEQDAHYCEYEFEPNYPINKLFFTGVMID